MEKKYFIAYNNLAKYGQEQLLDCFEKLEENNKKNLLDDIFNTDFEQVNKLYGKIKSHEEENNTAKKIEPILYIDKSKIEDKTKDYYDSMGEKIIKNGEYAVVTMAGGQGTRLGHDGPKGTYDIGLKSHKSIFEILCDKIKNASEKYETKIPWYIMTSIENNEDTTNFFEQNNYFNYGKENIIFFKQDQLPMINENGKVLLNEQGRIKKAADGHGGIFYSMRNNGIINDMKEKNIKWVFICGVDNILVNMVDPTFLGLTVDKNVLAAGKSVVKACPEEKVGAFCKKNGRPSVVEYTEISKEMSEARNENGDLKYGESHILCNLFNLEVIKDMSMDKLPYHSAYKKANYMDNTGNIVIADKPNAYKFEAFIFDAFESLDDMVIMRVKREEEFAPVKNKDGVDSPETARNLYTKFYNLD